MRCHPEAHVWPAMETRYGSWFTVVYDTQVCMNKQNRTSVHLQYSKYRAGSDFEECVFLNTTLVHLNVTLLDTKVSLCYNHSGFTEAPSLQLG